MLENRNRPLLTIAIPTYNRETCLATLLSNLAPQVKDEPRVQLIISDNASLDGTQSLVKQANSNGMEIEYIRNDSNLGADRNILQCFDKAAAKYVWILGDDDVVVPGGVSRVLSLLSAENVDLVYASSYSFEGEYVNHGTRTAWAEPKFMDAKKFAKCVNIFLTFISGVIVNKDLFLESNSITGLEQFVGSRLVQLGWVLAVLRDAKRCCVIPDALIAARAENTGGYGLCEVFGPNLRKVVDTVLGHASSAAAAIQNASLMSFFPPFLLKSRRGAGAFEVEDATTTLASIHRGNPRFWFFVYPVLKLPQSIAGRFMYLTGAVNRANRHLGYPLL